MDTHFLIDEVVEAPREDDDACGLARGAARRTPAIVDEIETEALEVNDTSQASGGGDHSRLSWAVYLLAILGLAVIVREIVGGLRAAAEQAR